jgi:hypothetical protein
LQARALASKKTVKTVHWLLPDSNHRAKAAV